MGDIVYSIPNDLWLSYLIRIFKYIFLSFLVSLYFETPYTVVTMAIAVLVADLHFYVNLQQYIDTILEDEE